jgi:hypothetical protein
LATPTPAAQPTAHTQGTGRAGSRLLAGNPLDVLAVPPAGRAAAARTSALLVASSADRCRVRASLRQVVEGALPPRFLIFKVQLSLANASVLSRTNSEKGCLFALLFRLCSSASPSAGATCTSACLSTSCAHGPPARRAHPDAHAFDLDPVRPSGPASALPCGCAWRHSG